MRTHHFRQRQCSYDIQGLYEELPSGDVTIKKVRLDSRERRRLQRRLAQGHRSRSPQKTGSRSRSRHRVVALPHGILQCTSGVRSRSATPERNLKNRVSPKPKRAAHTLQISERDKENGLAMLSTLKRKLKSFCEKESQIQPDVPCPRTDHSSHASAPNLVTGSWQRSLRGQNGVYSSSASQNTLYAGGATLPLRQQAESDSASLTRTNSLYSRIRMRRKSGQSITSSVYSHPPSISSIQSRPLPPIPAPAPPKESKLDLERTLDLRPILRNKWISGLAVTRKGDIVVVDLKDCHILDCDGNLKRSVGLKGSVRLTEPIDVTVLAGGNLAISDHADREVKIYTPKGQFVRRVRGPALVNIAGVAANDSREMFIAGTDSQHVGIHTEEGSSLGCIPGKDSSARSPFEHPYSVAVNPLSGAVIVGDDYRQRVVAVTRDGKVLWRFCPTGDRLFFPSSIAVDSHGYVFVADLYNEKVYMLDSGGKYLKTLLSRGSGLRGAPSAIAVDNNGKLYVADDEKTIKIFQYGSDGFALYRRFSKGPGSSRSSVRAPQSQPD